MAETFDLIVIGGGSAGLVAAGGAGILGARVALIEKDLLGGDCLYTGCVPSKTLIRSARFAQQVRNASNFGFEQMEPRFLRNDFASINERIRRVIETIEPHDSPERFRALGVDVVFGSPRFLNPREIEVTLKATGEKQILKAKRFIIATGSSPAVPEIEGLRDSGFVTNEEIFSLEKLPGRFLVLGGGALGVELGQAFSRLGSKVTIVEMAERLLLKEDEEVSAAVESVLRKEGLTIHTGTRIRSVRKTSDKTKICTLENSKGSFHIEADEILVAVGRRPNIEGLELEKAGVTFNERCILTDKHLRTSARNIFAAGDVTAHFQFTHMADYEAQIVLQNVFAPFLFRKKADFRSVPWATFSDPEIARVGLTEKEAREKFGPGVAIYKESFSDNDRANTEDEIQGFLKVVSANGRILGAHIVGAHAGELIHEFVWAVKNGWKISELNKIIRVYPTFSKITQAIGTQSTIEKLQLPLTKKILKAYLKFMR